MNLPADQLFRLAWMQFGQVTALILAVGLLTRLGCRQRPHLAYVLWMVVIAKCLTPPLWSSPLGVFWLGAGAPHRAGGRLASRSIGAAPGPRRRGCPSTFE
jgi:hypothetical protein